MTSPVKIWRNQEHIRSLLDQEGIIVSWTIIRVPPGTHSEFAPYAMAIVRFKSGKQITVPLVDVVLEEVSIGLRVKTVLRRLTHPDQDGVIHYGIKVVPV
jgi:uncharacterized OB-fold protein